MFASKIFKLPIWLSDLKVVFFYSTWVHDNAWNETLFKNIFLIYGDVFFLKNVLEVGYINECYAFIVYQNSKYFVFVLFNLLLEGIEVIDYIYKQNILEVTLQIYFAIKGQFVVQTSRFHTIKHSINFDLEIIHYSVEKLSRLLEMSHFSDPCSGSLNSAYLSLQRKLVNVNITMLSFKKIKVISFNVNAIFVLDKIMHGSLNCFFKTNVIHSEAEKLNFFLFFNK